MSFPSECQAIDEPNTRTPTDIKHSYWEPAWLNNTGLGSACQDAILFDWLTALYPLWSQIDARLTGIGAAGGMAVLARSGCTTVGDHHYIFPQGSGDIVGAIVEASQRIGVRLHATRGSMDLGASQGGLPPDFAVETTDAALRASAEAVERYHDPSFDSRVRVAIASSISRVMSPVMPSQDADFVRSMPRARSSGRGVSSASRTAVT